MIDLFDHETRRAEANSAKKAGMEQVAENASEEWSRLMLELTRLTCLEQPRFTADDVMDRYDALPDDKPVTHELRALGPVMMSAAKRGFCRKANTAPLPSRRRSLHASPRAVWDSLIYLR